MAFGLNALSQPLFAQGDIKEVQKYYIPLSPPPEGYQGRSVNSQEIRSRGGKMLEDVPYYFTQYGCSITAGAMLIGYLDIVDDDFGNLYIGPTNGSVCPPSNETEWNGAQECPIAATHIGVDGRPCRGYVEDYYGYPDPYIAAGVTPHTDDCLGDFSGTYRGNNKVKGSTLFDHSVNSLNIGAKSYPSENPTMEDRGVAFGLMKYFEMKNIPIDECYNQYITGYEGEYDDEDHTPFIVENGFTFNDYKSYIDKNIPVLLHFTGHTCLGIGYSTKDGKDMIHFRTTWLWAGSGYEVGEAEWGGVFDMELPGDNEPYSGILCGVTVIDPVADVNVGFEDKFELAGDDILSIEEGESATFSCNYIDIGPQGGGIDKVTFNLALYHSGGNYTIKNISFDPESPMTKQINMSCIIPAIPQGYDWLLDDNSNIKGRIIADGKDSEGWAHQAHKRVLCKVVNSNNPNISQFYADDLKGSSPFLTSFHVKNSGGIILKNSYYWNFGDGNTSRFKNPTHTYDNAGVYTVTLKVTGKNGDITSTKASYITVTDDATDMLNFTGSNSWEKISGCGTLEWQKDVNGLSNNLKITQGTGWETTISGKKTVKKFVGTSVERIKMGINLSFPVDAVNPITSAYRGNVQLLAKSYFGYWYWVGQFDINSIGLMSTGPNNEMLYANYEFLLPNNVVSDLKNSGLDFRLRLSSVNPGDWVTLEQIRFEDGGAEANRVLSESLAEIATKYNTTVANVKSSATSYESYINSLETNLYRVVYIEAVDPADAVSKKFYFHVQQDIERPMYLVEWWSKQTTYKPEVPTQSSGIWRQCWTYLGKE